MPRIDRIKTGRDVTGGGSVGRQRINAPAEAFGGGSGLSNLASGLQTVGAGINQMEERAAQEQKRNDSVDLRAFQTQAQNVYNEAHIRAASTADEKEVDRLFEEANKAVNSMLPKVARTPEAQNMASTWLEGEVGRRSNQKLAITMQVRDRATKAKEETTLKTLKTSAHDVGSLQNNKGRILRLWADRADAGKVTEEEAELLSKEDLREADMEFANKLLGSVNEVEDTSEEMAQKLSAYDNFVKSAESISESDRIKLGKNTEFVSKKIRAKRIDEAVQREVLALTPPSAEQEDYYKTEEGQLKRLELVDAYVDNREEYKDLKEEEKAYIKSKAKSIVSQSDSRINAQRRDEVEAYIADMSSDLDVLIASDKFSMSEKDAMRKELAGRENAVRVNQIMKQLPSDIESFDPDSASVNDMLAMSAKIAAAPEAARSVYKRMFDDKIDASKRSVSYKDNFSQLSRMLKMRYNLDEKSMKKDKTVDGVNMTPTQRISKYADDMRYLRMIAEEEKDNPAMFSQRADQYLMKQSEKTALQIKLEKVKRLSK